MIFNKSLTLYYYTKTLKLGEALREKFYIIISSQRFSVLLMAWIIVTPYHETKTPKLEVSTKSCNIYLMPLWRLCPFYGLKTNLFAQLQFSLENNFLNTLPVRVEHEQIRHHLMFHVIITKPQICRESWES